MILDVSPDGKHVETLVISTCREDRTMVEGREFDVLEHAQKYLWACLQDWDLPESFLIETDEGWLVLFIEGETHLGVVG
jgi:hypothetical protein